VPDVEEQVMLREVFREGMITGSVFASGALTVEMDALVDNFPAAGPLSYRKRQTKYTCRLSSPSHEHLAQHDPVPSTSGTALDNLLMLIFPTVGLADGCRARPRLRGSPAALARGLIAFGAFSIRRVARDHWSRQA